MSKTLENTTIIPVKTDDVSWDNFAALIRAAYETARYQLTVEIPTPPMTADRSSDEWMTQYRAQQDVARRRTAELNKYEAQLIASIAEALEASVPLFKELFVEYRGSGDSGESCDISVEIERGYKATEKTSWGTLCFTNEQNEEFRAREKAATALLPSDLTEWLDEICWGLAYQQHPGFEIDAGGYGTITVKRNDAGEMKLSLEHTQRYESTEEYAPQELN
jgi:hypothetical protein